VLFFYHGNVAYHSRRSFAASTSRHRVVLTEPIPAAPFIPSPTPALMFKPGEVGIRSFAHMVLGLAYVVNAFVAAVALRFVVARAKKCWDFGATMYILHIVACWAFNGFPMNMLWWTVIAACSGITILFGEFLCVRFEMADIPLGMGTMSRKCIEAFTVTSALASLLRVFDTPQCLA
jgi:hypothetical protein